MVRRYLPVEHQRLPGGESGGQGFQCANPLAEDDCLAPAIDDFFQIGGTLLELGAVSAGWIEVTNLLQPQHELKDMLDRDLTPQLIEPQDALALRHLVALALLCRELDLGIADRLGR